MKRYLGIDFGLQKIGLAIGDDQTKIAFPRPAVLYHQHPAQMIIEYCQREGCDEIVLGLPRSTDGTDSKQTELTRAFGAELEAAHLVVHYIDERFSTQGVQRQQQHRTLERGQEDSFVAQALVQSFLDSQ